jgi:hypothetical protein
MVVDGDVGDSDSLGQDRMLAATWQIENEGLGCGG